MSTVFLGMYIPLYTKSSVEKCGDGIQNGECARNTWGETTCEKRELETKVPGIAAHLLDDGPDVWETLLILCTWPIVTADHLVKFCMSTCLDFWM